MQCFIEPFLVWFFLTFPLYLLILMQPFHFTNSFVTERICLSRRQIAHPISNLPGKLQKLIRSQTGLWFHVWVFIVSVLEPATLPQVTQQVSIRHILNENKQRIWKRKKGTKDFTQLRDFRNYLPTLRLIVNYRTIINSFFNNKRFSSSETVLSRVKVLRFDCQFTTFRDASYQSDNMRVWLQPFHQF